MSIVIVLALLNLNLVVRIKLVECKEVTNVKGRE